MFGAYWVAASFVEETLIECVSRWFGAGGSVFGVRPALFCADAANKLANVWVVGRQWKPSSGFPHGAQSRDYVQRSARAYERCASNNIRTLPGVELDRGSPYLAG